MTRRLGRTILISLVSGIAWGLVARWLMGRSPSAGTPGGVAASPLIGLLVGVTLGNLQPRSFRSRALLSLLGLYASAALFGLAVGIWDLMIEVNNGPGWHRIPSAVVIQSVLGVLWGLTMLGYVIVLWPLAFLNFSLIWKTPVSGAKEGEGSMGRIQAAVLILGLAIAASAMAVEQGTHESGSITPVLLRLENDWAAGLVRRDGAMFRRLLAKGFIYTENDNMMGRDTLLRELMKGSDRVTEAHNEGMRVHSFGNTAVVTGWLVVGGQGSGGPFHRRYRFTDTWVRMDGDWKIVAAHDYLAPTKAR